MTVTSNVGLFSGLDYNSLVDQLIAIDARPRDLLKLRMTNLDAQRTAFADISARITALLSRVTTLNSGSFFDAATANSSNSDVLSATVSAAAQPGSYTFTVRSLATAHQLLSRGFASRDTALSAGTLTIESSQARVDRETTLNELNGFSGVQRGSFKLTDGSGAEATIDISDAQTLGDVIDRINDAAVGVEAQLSGEGIALRDTSGGTQGLRIAELNDGHTAADLGFATGNTYSADGTLLGSDIMYLSDGTPLSALNDGLGIRRALAGTDFTIKSGDGTTNVNVELSEIVKEPTRLERLNHGRGVELGTIKITSKTGQTVQVDLSSAHTVGDVKHAIENALGPVDVVLAGGRLMITDSSNATTSNLIVEDVSGHAARDLGILGNTKATKINGKQVLHVDTLGDIIAAVNFADGNSANDGTPIIQAALDTDGQRLVITDHGGGSGVTTFELPAGSTSRALVDLGFQTGEHAAAAGLAGQRVIGGLDSVLLKTLNGGNGLAGGIIHIDANGAAADVDLRDAETLRDVVERINTAAQTASLGLTAGYDSTGTRLLIRNTTDDSAAVTISDVEGTFAQATGLAASGSRLRSENLQRRYISEATQLADLNSGRGVTLGRFKITDSRGMSGTVDLLGENAGTLQDVLDAVNGLDIGVEARINDTGDGLMIVDTAGGTNKLKIEEDGGTTAHDLNILGTAEQDRIDGSFELKLELTGHETLDEVVSRINESTLASANVINDGSSSAPYRLTIASQATGRAGELIVDDGVDLDLTTLSRAQDASILFGTPGEAGVLITNSTNSFSGIVDGLTLNVNSVDDQPVTITVARDVDAMVTALNGLVNGFNSVSDRISNLSKYDPTTQTAGILLGDGTLRLVQSRLFRAFTGAVPGATGPLTRLSQLGISFEDGDLTFDEQKFRDAYNADPEAVKQFFTAAETGLSPQLKKTLEGMTDANGLLKRQDSTLADEKELLSDRVDALNTLLDQKRARLLTQFQNMEQTLAQLQNQQSSLSSLSSLLATMTSSS